MPGFTIEREPNLCRVVLRGNLTAALVPDLQAALRQELAGELEELVVDLSRAAMLDSSGIGLLIATSNSLATRPGKRFRVTGASEDIFHLLQSMRLVSRLNVTRRDGETADG